MWRSEHVQNKCCWTLKHSYAHVESAIRFDHEGLHQLQCTKCVWEVLFIYSHQYPEAKRWLLCIATDEGLRGQKVLHSLHMLSCVSMLNNICSESMSAARMSLYSIWACHGFIPTVWWHHYPPHKMIYVGTHHVVFVRDICAALVSAVPMGIQTIQPLEPSQHVTVIQVRRFTFNSYYSRKEG